MQGPVVVRPLFDLDAGVAGRDHFVDGVRLRGLDAGVFRTVLDTAAWADGGQHRFGLRVVFHDGGTRCAERTWTVTAGNAACVRPFPSGIVMVTGFSTRPSFDAGFFDAGFDYVAGFAVIERWRDLQPTLDGPLDFTFLDAMNSVSVVANRPWFLLVRTGAGAQHSAPQFVRRAPLFRPWVIDPDPGTGGTRGTATAITPSSLTDSSAAFSGSDVGSAVRCGASVGLISSRPTATTFNVEEWLPSEPSPGCAYDVEETNLVPWDPVVIDGWLNLSSQLAARYDASPTFAGLYLSGANAKYPEMWFIGRTPAFRNATASAPVGIASRTYEALAPLDPDGGVFGAAWLGVLDAMSGQFRCARVVNMIDAVQSASGTPQWGPLRDINDRVQTRHAQTATVGTANWSESENLASYKFQALRRDAGVLSSIAYEIGPLRLSGNPGDLYGALTSCREYLGCDVAFVHYNSLFPSNSALGNRRRSEARDASYDAWGR